MTGTLSPDGKWMWNGAEWIPAPPNQEIDGTSLPQTVEEPIPELSYTPTAPPSLGAKNSEFWNNPQNNLNEKKSKSGFLGKSNNNQVNPFSIEIVSKKFFPKASMRFKFTNPNTGMPHDIKFTQVVRSWKVETNAGVNIGTLKMKGFTIFSGIGGNLTLPDGGLYRADMKIKIFSGIDKKSFTLTDLATGNIFRAY